MQVNSTKAAGSVAAGPGVGATSGTAGTAGSAPVQSDLDLFSENSSNKAEDSTKKPLSKDSILSLYGSSTVPQQPAQGIHHTTLQIWSFAYNEPLVCF